MELKPFVRALDELLALENFSDDTANNGLQLANSGSVTHVAVGVDVSLRFLRAAAEEGADCVIAHHGLSWKNSLAYVTGLNYELVSFAIQNDIAIYAAHLPLDAHPKYGNNAQLCAALGLKKVTLGFPYHGMPIGYTGEFTTPISMDDVLERVQARIAPQAKALAFGKQKITRVGVVSGGASDMIALASEMNCDLFLTGEPSLVGYNMAENLGMNVIFGGHYATETFGVRALGKWLTQKFRIPSSFIDFGIEY